MPETCHALDVQARAGAYREAAGLVSAFSHGETELFAQLLAESKRDVVVALVSGTYAAVALLAERNGVSFEHELQRYCRCAAVVAEHYEP